MPPSIAKGNGWLLLFIFNSAAIQTMLGQDDTIVRFSPIYWALVLPALVIPCFAFGEVVRTFFGKSILLLAFLAIAGLYHSARGDFQTIAQLFLLIWVTVWCAGESLRITEYDLVKFFSASVVLGALIALLTNLNPWGFFPGATPSEYGPWRVSFSPHIANSGTLSLIVFMALTRNMESARSHKIVLAACLYFILFGFVRTVIVSCALYLLLLTLYKVLRSRKPAVLFGGALIVTAGSVACEWLANSMLQKLQWLPFVSRILLRSQTGLDHSSIYEQLYRPWLWSEHLSIFASSPHLMGLGTFNLLDHVSHNIMPGLDASGSESFPTRLLAVYGIPALLFFIYLLAQLGRSARAKDVWACACFPSIIFMMMNWGSVFHPSNAFFVLFFILLKGRDGIEAAQGRPLLTK